MHPAGGLVVARGRDLASADELLLDQHFGERVVAIVQREQRSRCDAQERLSGLTQVVDKTGHGVDLCPCLTHPSVLAVVHELEEVRIDQALAVTQGFDARRPARRRSDLARSGSPATRRPSSDRQARS